MREIKFRAWDKFDNKMIDSDSWYFSEEFEPFIDSVKNCQERYEIMQYTGIHDKNRKEIYEGDFVINGDPKIRYVIEFYDGAFKARQLGNSSTLGIFYFLKTIEIIGNKHQVKHLYS